MITFILRKIAYGLLVLWGVVSLVFFLFNLAPGDPVRNLVGENASEEVIANMRRKLDLDLTVGRRYVLYLNDLSPVAIHSNIAQSRIYFNPAEYSGFRLGFGGEGKTIYLKAPYLKRSFLTDKSVSSILSEVLPGTVVLAVVSIGLALIAGLLLGIAAALKKDGFYDRLILFVCDIIDCSIFAFSTNEERIRMADAIVGSDSVFSEHISHASRSICSSRNRIEYDRQLVQCGCMER